MSDATLPLRKAIIAALKADAGVTALVGTRIYDVAPTGPVKPYITFGPVDVVTEVASEYEGSETSLQLDAWSAGPSSEESNRIGRAVRGALHEKELILSDNQRLVSLTVESVRYLRDNDGIAQHAVVTMQALTEPSA